MDSVYIRNLNVSALIGTLPKERRFRQNLILNIVFRYDASKAAETDDLFCAVDYSKMERDIIQTVETSSFFLMEALANRIVNVCLADARVEYVKVTIDKPAAAMRASSIAFEMERTR